MEVTVDGRSYQLWKDCAYCFLRGFDNDCITPCEHTSKVTNYLETVPVKETGGTMQSYFEPSSMYGSPRQSSVRGSWNDSKVTIFPDSDSGFSSLKTRLVGDEMALTPRSSGTLVRANSMNRLNGSYNSQDLTPFNVSHSMNMHPVLERSLRTLKDSLEDSENRRVVLMHKLKEAQDTLSLQGERLAKIENSAKGNSILVEDLKLKEQDYRRKINALEKSEEDREMLRMENLRLREEMQDRISKLDFQLRSLQAQHEVAEHENQKRIGLLDQSTTALTMLEADNNKLKADNDTYRQELAVVKESLNLTKERYEPVEMENKSLRAEVYRLREENSDLNKKLAELTGQLSELRKLTQSMKDENEKLASAWKTLAEEKQSSARQLESAQDKASEMKAKASTASAEKDRLFQEKMDLNNKFQQLIVNKEQIERANQVLQEQLEEYQNEAQRAKNSSRKREEERDIMEDELHEAKRLNQELEDELQTVKSYYEKACEQISVLENTKKTANQQQEWTIQENERLKGEVDRLSKDGDEEDWVSDNRSKEMRRERDELEHTIQGMKNELRDLRHENSQLGNKNQELETKLRKANADLRSEAEVQREELQTWKDTSERLTASVHKQEAEIRDLMDRCDELEEYNAKMKSDNRTLQDECEELRDHKEDVDRLKKENKKLLQENAENEQMIKLLETQKEVLTKNVYKNYLESTTSLVSDAYPESDNEIESESQLAKLHDIDVLGAKVEQFRDENATLRERILELEKVRDNLQIERDELQTCKELIYNKPKMEELDRQVDELRETNRQLREMNESIAKKVDVIEQENLEMREAIGGDGSLVPRGDFERLEEDKQQLQDELDQVKKDLNNMKQKHQQYVQEFGPDGESSYQSNERIRKLEKEKQGLEKQVALINGQLLLVEGSKKRLDEVVEDLQHEIVHLRRELEEAEKQIASLQAEEKTGPVGTAEMQQLQEEIENLREALASSQKDKMKQDKLVRSLKEESLDDVGSDLTEMRGELNKLMGVIQDKDHEIENLEDQLRQSKSASKERSGQDQDQMRKSRSPTRASRIPRKTEDEAVRRPITKENGFHSPTKSLGEYKSGSKSGASESLRLSDPEPRSKSSGDKGSDRLQSLISKYRSHSESPFPERKIKPLSLSKEGNKMGLVTRGKSFGPAAPKDGKVSDSQTGDKHSKDLAESEHKSPIEKSQTESERKDIHNVNIGFQSKEEENLSQESQASVFSIPPALDQSKPLDIESPLLSKLQSPLLSPPSDFNAQLSPKLFESEANGVPRRGRRASAGDVDEFPDIDAPIDPEGLDSREQDDIDALIRNCYRSHLLFLVTLRRQRAASGHTSPGGKISSPQQKPLLSVNPPKLTSKIIADLLNTRPQYRSSPPLSLSLPTSIHRLSESHIKILEKELKT